MKIEPGKTYINTDSEAYPESMYGASVTVISINPKATSSQMAVEYSYIDKNGQTGEGAMRLAYAQEFLRTNQDIVTLLAPDAVCANDGNGGFWIRSGGHMIAKGETEQAAWKAAHNL